MLTSEYVKMSLKYKEDKSVQKNIKENTEPEFDYHSVMESAYANKNKIFALKKDIKKSLLFEAIENIYENSIPGIQLNTSRSDLMKKNIINKFIQEEGVENLLNKFKTKSYVLSEMSRVVNKYYDIIVEKIDVEHPDAFTIDIDDKNSFYDEIDTDDVDELTSTIKQRVALSMDEFITNNMQNKVEIKEIMQNTQDKINSNRDEFKESYEMNGKRAISNIENKPKNILEAMILKLSKSAFTNESVKEVYMKDSLDIDTIVEDCKTMYTFLEMLNTAKMKKIDRDYVSNILKNLE